jgi:hypothetical protein
MLLYVGPDQLIPLSGVFGTVFGLALIFWGKLLQGFRKVSGYFSRSADDKSQS